jgi:hypothetical protein
MQQGGSFARPAERPTDRPIGPWRAWELELQGRRPSGPATATLPIAETVASAGRRDPAP